MALADKFEIERVIKDAINKRVAEIANEEYAAAVERINLRRDEAITGVVLAIEKYLSFERVGPTLRIELRQKE